LSVFARNEEVQSYPKRGEKRPLISGATASRIQDKRVLRQCILQNCCGTARENQREKAGVIKAEFRVVTLRGVKKNTNAIFASLRMGGKKKKQAPTV